MILVLTHKGDANVKKWMADHYSAPRGFVGRQIIYAVFHEGAVFGAIAGGSATRFLPGRPFICPLDNIVNNTFFHVAGPYPFRNFVPAVIAEWRHQVSADWERKYGSVVQGFETLVELPRTGECYRRDGWREVGLTKGFTCKRVGGKGTDSWSGKRVWDTVNLRPKRVFVREP